MKKGQFLQIIVSIILIMYSYSYHYGYFDYIQTHDLEMNAQVYYINMMILFLAHVGLYYGLLHAKPSHTNDYLLIACLASSFLLFAYIMYRDVKHREKVELQKRRDRIRRLKEAKKKSKESYNGEEEDDEEDNEEDNEDDDEEKDKDKDKDKDKKKGKNKKKTGGDNLTSIMDIPVLLLFLVWLGIGFFATTDTQARITMTLASLIMILMMYLMIPYYRKRKNTDHMGYVFILASWILATYHLARDV